MTANFEQNDDDVFLMAQMESGQFGPTDSIIQVGIAPNEEEDFKGSIVESENPLMKNSVFSFQVDSPGSSKKQKYEAMTEKDIVVIEE